MVITVKMGIGVAVVVMMEEVGVRTRVGGVEEVGHEALIPEMKTDMEEADGRGDAVQGTVIIIGASPAAVSADEAPSPRGLPLSTYTPGEEDGVAAAVAADSGVVVAAPTAITITVTPLPLPLPLPRPRCPTWRDDPETKVRGAKGDKAEKKDGEVSRAEEAAEEEEVVVEAVGVREIIQLIRIILLIFEALGRGETVRTEV